MAKRWFGFSEHVLAGAVSLTAACICTTMTIALAGADEGTPLSIPSSAPVQVMNYPFVDLVSKAKAGAVHVGDKIEVALSGGTLGSDLGPDLSLAVPETQADAVYDQGWSVGPGLLVSPLKTGQLSLPSLEVKNRAGQVVAKTNPFSLGVESSISTKDPKPQEPADLRPPVGVPIPLYLRIIMGSILLTLLGVGGYFLWKWIATRNKKPAFIEPLLSEDESALRALEKLLAKGHLECGEHKIHYFRLSEILKKYLGERFDFDAPESTTYELVEKLRQEESINLIHGFFDGLDLVKFTDHVPVGDENQKRIQEAREIIQKTRKVVQPLYTTTGPEVRR